MIGTINENESPLVAIRNAQTGYHLHDGRCVLMVVARKKAKNGGFSMADWPFCWPSFLCQFFTLSMAH